MKKYYWALILGLFGILLACEGPAGETGLTGTAGINGVTGETGPTGENAACLNNHPPVINGVSFQSRMVVGRTYPVVIEAADADPDSTLTYSLVGSLGHFEPTDPAGTFNFIPTEAGGPITLTAIVSDGCEIALKDFVIESIDYSGWSKVGEPGIATFAGDFQLFAYNGTPYLAFMDAYASNKISVMQYRGNQWNYAGQPGIVASAPYIFNLFVNATPYLSFADTDDAMKLKVVKYNGVGWEYVGGAIGTVSGISISMSMEQGVIYVAFSDALDSDKPKVFFYNSETAAWEQIGTAVIDHEAYSVSLFVENQIPYLALIDNTDYKIKVKYHDGSWNAIGGDFSNADSNYVSLVVDSGTPFVSYYDPSGLLKIQKFDNTDLLWKDFGPQNVYPPSPPFAMPLQVYQGIPYTLAYVYPDPLVPDQKNLRLLKYSGAGIQWDPLGNPTFYDEMPAPYLRMVIDKGIVFVAFYDMLHPSSISVVKYVE